MTYPFVSSYHDLGPRKGPILGLIIHMAEGGGTVGFLHRQNRDGVSVHYVIELSGKIVQMLDETHMHSSIRIGSGGSALRTDTGADGFGAVIARAVLGSWAYISSTLGPNHSTIAVEIEGFAGTVPLSLRADYPTADPLGGPNEAQEAALVRLVDDLRTRYPNLGLTGHRDHNIKACPGQRIPWDRLGGHGRYEEGNATMALQVPETDHTIALKAGTDFYADPARRSRLGELGKDATVRYRGAAIGYASRAVLVKTGTAYSDNVARLTEVFVADSAGTPVPVDPPPPPPAPDCQPVIDSAVAAAVAATKASAKITWG